MAGRVDAAAAEQHPELAGELDSIPPGGERVRVHQPVRLLAMLVRSKEEDERPGLAGGRRGDRVRAGPSWR